MDLMPDFKELLRSEQAKRLMKDQSAIRQLQDAPESRRLMELLGQQAGGDLEGAASAAAEGSPAQLMGAMQKLLRDPESKKLLEQLSQSLKL